MKKFLSLVLALIMTMSLVTIGASAAEYKDFTDKDEITYAEAVAVLNRLGIITGYSEGDFRPEGELTRGAAAKIIASLLIGPEAANNLTPTTAPFKDVPLDHTFAGPIAYCSTLKIINGYSDGSFQPGGTLTGYAFSKMLLGALGYDGNVEGFVGSGWNMNVMRLGGDAGLFDSISFKGNEPVNREQAAQLALNTLKATLVEYTGGLNVTAGDASVTSKPTRTYVISNQEFATHISNRKASEVGNANVTTHYTVEFGEQHFVDLRMTYDRNTYDDFGRPSNEWSYKKVTIGTFPIEPDYIYTEQMEHNVSTVTNATKARALGLVGFEIKSDSGKPTTVTINGFDVNAKLTDVGQIADYTDNGTVVEVYVDDQDADWIRDVVVVKTQLMEVKRIGKDYVALDLYDSGSDGKNQPALMGFNQTPVDATVKNVEVNDDYYTMLSGLKVDDLVAVVPVTVDGGTTYSVAKAYVPETVSGKLNSVESYGSNRSDPSTIGVTVGDTAYDVALWNKDLYDIDGQKLDVTNKDVTLILDEFGNALLAKNVGATSDFMIVGGWYQSLVDGKLVNYVKGWDISGQELNLNVGTNKTNYSAIQPGDLVYYTNKGVTNSYADWVLSENRAQGVFDIYQGIDNDKTNENYEIKASNTRIKVLDPATSVLSATIGDRPWTDKNVKFIYVTFDDDGDVDYIEIKKGVQAVKDTELDDRNPKATDATFNATQVAVAVNDDGNVKPEGTVKAVVIKNESNDASASNMLYVVNYKGTATKRSDDGEIVYGYTVAMNGPNGLVDEEMTIYSTKQLSRGDWARYTETQDDNFENFYTLKLVNQRNRATSTMDATIDKFIGVNHALLKVNKAFVPGTKTELNGTVALNTQAPNVMTRQENTLGTGEPNGDKEIINTRNATWVDLTGNNIRDFDDLYDLTQKEATKKFNLSDVTLSMIFNDDPSKDGFRSVAMVVVRPVEGSDSSSSSGTGSIVKSFEGNLALNGNLTVTLDIEKPGFVPAGATVNGVEWILTVDGAYYDSGVLNGLRIGKQIVSLGRTNLTTSDKWELRIVDKDSDGADIVWSDVNVTYTNKPALTAGSLPASIPSGNYSFDAVLGTSAYTAGYITVKDNGTTLVNHNSVVLHATNPLYASAVDISGKGLVEMAFDMTKAPGSYNITAKTGWTDVLGNGTTSATGLALTNFDLTSAQAGTAVLKIDTDQAANTAIAENTSVVFTAKLGGSPDATGVAGYYVSATIGGKAMGPVFVDDGTGAELGFLTMTGNAEITAVTVTPVYTMALESVTITNSTVVMTFNNEVDPDTVTADASGVTALGVSVASGADAIATSIVVNGKTVTFNLSAGAVAAGDTFTPANTVAAKDTNAGACNGTTKGTVQSNGTVTVA